MRPLTLAWVFLLASTCVAQGWTISRLPDRDAQTILNRLIPDGKKFASVIPYVLNTQTKVVDRGSVCYSSSTSSSSGSIDEFGNINTTGESNGSSSCSHEAIGYYTMYLGIPDADDQKATYVLTVQCVERWIWNHCTMPTKGQSYPLIIEREKHGSFNVYAATRDKVGAKAKVASFSVIKVEHARQTAAVKR